MCMYAYACVCVHVCVSTDECECTWVSVLVIGRRAMCTYMHFIKREMGQPEEIDNRRALMG